MPHNKISMIFANHQNVDVTWNIKMTFNFKLLSIKITACYTFTSGHNLTFHRIEHHMENINSNVIAFCYCSI